MFLVSVISKYLIRFMRVKIICVLYCMFFEICDNFIYDISYSFFLKFIF